MSLIEFSFSDENFVLIFFFRVMLVCVMHLFS